MNKKDTSQSITHKFTIDRYEAYLIISEDEHGSPRNIFVKISKQGSVVSGLMGECCLLANALIDRSKSIQPVIDLFKGTRFDPMGYTSNPEIPEVSSLCDYVARFIEINYPLHGGVN